MSQEVVVLPFVPVTAGGSGWGGVVSGEWLWWVVTGEGWVGGGAER